MIKIKRIIAIMLAVFVLAACLPAAAAENELHFDGEGGFTIMLIADLQDNMFTTDALVNAIAAVIADKEPDLIVLLGDQIEGWHPFFKLGDTYKNTQKAVDAIIAPVVESGIPFLAVLGNHDSEMGLDRDTVMGMYTRYATCLNRLESDTSLPGAGNCCVTVCDSAGRAALSLYAIDSLDYAGDGYACVTREQIAWRRERSAKLRDEFGGTVPAMVFQHIVVPEIYDALKVVPEGTAGAVEGRGAHAETYYSAVGVATAGGLREAPSPSELNEGEFFEWVDSGDVFAAFFGHDHLNDYVVPYEGIDLVNTTGCTFKNYADPALRGVRMVELNESDVKNYTTYTVWLDEYLDMNVWQTLRYRLFLTDGNLSSIVKTGIYAGAALILIVAAVLTAVLRSRRRRRKGERGEA